MSFAALLPSSRPEDEPGVRPGHLLARRPTAEPPEGWAAFEASVAEHARGLSVAQREKLRELLYFDMTSEFDARFFSAHVRALGLDLGDDFLAFEGAWARDEALHCEGFRRVNRLLFGWTDARFAELDRRRPDFAPLAHLFTDEFSIACLGAYDELATVRAYRSSLAWYDLLGPAFARFVRRVTADEGWHYSGFLRVLRRRHRHRFAEAPAVVAAIRASEGTPYACTFVLDHDDAVWSESMFDEASAVLLRHLGAQAPSASPARAARDG